MAGSALVVLTLVAAMSGIGWYLRRRYRRNGGTWSVECPADETMAEVELEGATRLGGPAGVAHCSHWPERAGCDQACVRG